MKISLLLCIAAMTIAMDSNRFAAASEPAPGDSNVTPGDGRRWMLISPGCKAYDAFGAAEIITWSGSCEGGYISGSGTLTKTNSRNSVTVTGSWINGRIDERTPILWTNGESTYTGEIHNGSLTGKGTLVGPHGAYTIVGTFKNGQPDGICMVTQGDNTQAVRFEKGHGEPVSQAATSGTHGTPGANPVGSPARPVDSANNTKTGHAANGTEGRQIRASTDSSRVESLRGGSDAPVSNSARHVHKSSLSALMDEQDSQSSTDEWQREQLKQQQTKQATIQQQRALLEQRQNILANQQVAVAQQENGLANVYETTQDDEKPPQRSNPNGNLMGSFAQAFVQMRTGNSALAAQAGVTAGADNDVVVNNAAQAEQNQQTQARAQQIIDERKAQSLARQDQLSHQQQQGVQNTLLTQVSVQPNKVWPVPTIQWCAANPNSGNPNCSPLTGSSSGSGGAPRLVPNLNKSSCVRIVTTSAGRYIKNDCLVPVNVAYCAFGPVDDGQTCSTSNGPFGPVYAQSSINRINPGSYASNTSVVSPQNRIAFFACQASGDGPANNQAILIAFSPPTGNCVSY